MHLRYYFARDVNCFKIFEHLLHCFKAKATHLARFNNHFMTVSFSNRYNCCNVHCLHVHRLLC
jgi:hypothetical protein